MLSVMADDVAGPQETPFAAQSQGQFIEPWHRRVRDIDDLTIAGLLQQLIVLRRMRNVVAVLCCVAGMGVFGALQIGGLYAVLIYGILAGMVGMPVFAIGTLSVRRLFLREARDQGLSLSAGVLVLTRAEREARFMSPFLSTETKVDRLLKAVREPDTAS
jgi:hypothetical protein